MLLTYILFLASIFFTSILFLIAIFIIKKETSGKKATQEISKEVESLIVSLNEASDRNVSILEDRIEKVSKLIKISDGILKDKSVNITNIKEYKSQEDYEKKQLNSSKVENKLKNNNLKKINPKIALQNQKDAVDDSVVYIEDTKENLNIDISKNEDDEDLEIKQDLKDIMDDEDLSFQTKNLLENILSKDDISLKVSPEIKSPQNISKAKEDLLSLLNKSKVNDADKNKIILPEVKKENFDYIENMLNKEVDSIEIDFNSNKKETVSKVSVETDRKIPDKSIDNINKDNTVIKDKRLIKKEIMTLYKSGISPVLISKKLSISIDEVNLTISLLGR